MSQRYLGGIITANPTTPTMTSESGVWTLEQQFQYSSVWSPETIGNSLRFRSSALPYLNRTFGTPTNNKIWSLSFWLKLGSNFSSSYERLFASTINGDEAIRIDSGSQFTYFNSTASFQLTTTQLFRDPSSWYHIVVSIDTTQATASNRYKLFVNGVQVTSFSTATYPAQNTNTSINAAGTNYIGSRAGTEPTDGYMAEIYFVDGQALTPFSFGAFDSTGVWQPLAYTGTYGTNGFYIDFSDNSGTTATTLGKDYSGNGNNWTPNNISLTAGTTYDWMLDTPTNSDNGGTGRGNYAVLNPLDAGTSFSPAEGNLYGGGGNAQLVRGSVFVSTGKWYWEVTCTALSSGHLVGIANNNASKSNYVGADSNGYGYASGGSKYTNGSGTAYGASWTTNDVIGVALDLDSGTLTFYKNNVSQGTAFSSLSGEFAPAYSTGTSSNVRFNFGQRPFTYTPPTGFKALNTQNLSTPTIMNGAQVMAATTYTGNGSTQTITNGGNNTIGTTFKPDFVWAKKRSGIENHELQDSVRGAGKRLASNTTDAETNATAVSSFNTNGFSVGNYGTTNENGFTYVAWQWQAGQGTTSSNTSGSITSTVSVNATAGFSIVTYTGTGANATVGHGLGVAPSMVIVKQRNSANSWIVYQVSLGATNYLRLETTAASAAATAVWNDTAPTSSVFTIGTSGTTNGSSQTYVAYCWAAVAGFSKFGSYTGNGSADGPFVYCGFRPRWIMLKITSAADSWYMFDTSRDSINVMSAFLAANSSSAEGSVAALDVTANGFKLRSTNTAFNASGGTYIYAAFAENPFKISRAR